ncbi:hypothetical protein MBLNU457_5054t1 [Dothideomycetes sp. NU457]
MASEQPTQGGDLHNVDPELSLDQYLALRAFHDALKNLRRAVLVSGANSEETTEAEKMYEAAAKRAEVALGKRAFDEHVDKIIEALEKVIEENKLERDESDNIADLGSLTIEDSA